jgi:maleylacetoacetate isomerase
MRLRLHTRFQNSAGQRVRIVLNLKGLDYEYVTIPSLSSEDYRSLNPQGLMPSLEVDGRIVTQSMAIVELLEELFPEPSILPADPVLRAQARAFAHTISADLHPINNNRVRRYLSGVLGTNEADVQRWYEHWVRLAFSSLETQLARRPFDTAFCFSDRPGLAEACLVPQVDNARRFNCDLSDYPLLTGIDAECRALDAFARAAPEAQPDHPDNGRRGH